MKIKQLIDELSKYDDNLEIKIKMFSAYPNTYIDNGVYFAHVDNIIDANNEIIIEGMAEPQT